MLYIWIKLLHLISAAISFGMIVLFNGKSLQNKSYLAKVILLPVLVIQLLSGVAMMEMAHYNLTDELWLLLGLTMLIITTLLTILMVVLGKYLTLLSKWMLLFLLVGYYVMVFQPGEF
jgi:uncharacterized membrane protein